MKLKGKKIGFILTGSFCRFKKVIPKIQELMKLEAEVIPIMSYNSYNLDTKYGKSEDFINEIEKITDKKIIHTIQDAELIGTKKKTDIMVIAPCSRKYNIKACLQYYRYTINNGCKIAFEKSDFR